MADSFKPDRQASADSFKPDIDSFKPDQAASPATSDHLSMGEGWGDVAKSFLNTLNPANIYQAVRHPIDTAEAIADQMKQARVKASDAWAKGNKAEAAEHFINGVVPVLGPMSEAINFGTDKEAADAVGNLGGLLLASRALPKIVEAAPGVAADAKTFATAPGTNMPIVKGAAKIAAVPAVHAVAHELGLPVGAVSAPLYGAELYGGAAGAKDIVGAIKGKIEAVKSARLARAVADEPEWKPDGGSTLDPSARGPVAQGSPSPEPAPYTPPVSSTGPLPLPEGAPLPQPPSTLDQSARVTQPAQPGVTPASYFPPVSGTRVPPATPPAAPTPYAPQEVPRFWSPPARDYNPPAPVETPAPPPPDPMLDKIAQGFGFKKGFSTVQDPAARATIQRLAAKMKEPATSRPSDEPFLDRVEQSGGKVEDLPAEDQARLQEIHAEVSQHPDAPSLPTPTPGQAPQEVPTYWTPPERAETPAPAPVPVEDTHFGDVEAGAEKQNAVQDLIARNRRNVVRGNVPDDQPAGGAVGKLRADGHTFAELEAMKSTAGRMKRGQILSAAARAFSKQKNYTTSPASDSAIMDELQRDELAHPTVAKDATVQPGAPEMTKAEKVAALSKQLTDAGVGEAYNPGDTVNLKDGNSVVIKKLNGDGTFEH